MPMLLSSMDSRHSCKNSCAPRAACFCAALPKPRQDQGSAAVAAAAEHINARLLHSLIPFSPIVNRHLCVLLRSGPCSTSLRDLVLQSVAAAIYVPGLCTDTQPASPTLVQALVQ